MIYLASPMASTKSKDSFSYSKDKLCRNHEIAEKLQDAGFEIFLPQDNQETSAEETLNKEFEMIRNSEFVIVLLSDTRGVYLTAGYAKGIGKKIYAVMLPETRKMPELLNVWFDYIANDIDELIEYLNNKQ